MSKRQPPYNRGHPPDVVVQFDDHVTIPAPVVRALQAHPISVSRAWVALKRRRADRKYVPVIVSELARETNLHRSTMRRALSRLRDAGLAKQRVDHGQERWKLIVVKVK